MNLIEPTYLRYVHGNLEKGTLNAENAAALPYGFIGLYEETFQSNIPISNRQSTLKRLAIWALFKGGVSSYLASQILVESQEDTKSLIDDFSSWFNTTDSNKYILYHDRLRSYLLQKLSSHELQELNEQIISYLETALEAQKGDEAEIYALEHLGTHMATESQMDSNYQRLHDFANQDDIWPRQVSVSKEYKWSQQAVQYSIKEAARRHNEMNTLSSTVNSVYLNNLEDENYDEIFKFLSNSEFEIALNRISSIKIENRYRIYFLILHETILGSLQEIFFKNDFFELILNEIENIKNDDRFNFKWPNFYSEILLIKIHLKLSHKDIDLSFVWEDEEFDFKKIINHDFDSKSERKIAINSLFKILPKKNLTDAQLEIVKFEIKNEFFESAKENLKKLLTEITPISINDGENYTSKQITKGEEHLAIIYKEISSIKNQKKANIESFKKIIFEKIFNEIDEENDKENKVRLIFNVIKSYNNEELLNDVIYLIETKLLELISNINLNHYLNENQEFIREISRNLFTIKNFKKAFEVIKLVDVDYRFLVKFLESEENVLNIEIADYVIENLNKEKEYEIYFDPDDKIHERGSKNPRGEILEKVSDFLSSTDNTIKALELTNQIDITKEFDATNKINSCMSIIFASVKDIPDGYFIDQIKVRENLNDYFLDSNTNKYCNKLINIKILHETVVLDQLKREYTTHEINHEIEKFIEHCFIEDEVYITKFITENNLLSQLNNHSLNETFFELISSTPKDIGIISDDYGFQLSKLLIELGEFEYVEEIISSIKTPIYKYYSFIILIKSLISLGEIPRAIKLASKFELIIFKKNLLVMCYVFCTRNNEFKYSKLIINKLINLSKNDNTKSLIYNSIYSTLKHFNKEEDIQYFLNNINELNLDFYNENDSEINELNIFIPYERNINFSNSEKITEINLNELNRDLDQSEIEIKIDEFDKILYSSRPYDDEVKLGFELLIFFHKKNFENSFNQTFAKTKRFISKETSGWYIFSDSIFEIVNEILEKKLKNFLQIDYLSKIVFLIEDNEKRSKSFTEIFKEFPKGFTLFKEIIDNEPIIEYLINSKEDFTHEEIIDIASQLESILPNQIIQILKEFNFEIKNSMKLYHLAESHEEMNIPYVIGKSVRVIDGPFNNYIGTIENIYEEKKKLMVMVKIFGRKTLLELNYMQVTKERRQDKSLIGNKIFENEFLKSKISYKDLLFVFNDVQENIIDTNKKFISNNFKHKILNNNTYDQIIKTLNDNNLLSETIKINLTTELFANNKILDFKKFILKNYKAEDFNNICSIISVELSELGYFKKSIEILNLIDEDEPNWVLDDSVAEEPFSNVLKTNTTEIICKNLMKNGLVEKSIELAYEIEHLINKIFLFGELADLYLIYSKDQGKFDIEKINQILIHKEKIYKYDEMRVSLKYDEIFEKISHKLSYTMIELSKKDKSKKLDFKLLMDLSFNYEKYKETTLKEGIEADEYFYENKGLNLAQISINLIDLGYTKEAKIFFNKSKKIFEFLTDGFVQDGKLIIGPWNTAGLLAELSIQILIICDKLQHVDYNKYLNFSYEILNSIFKSNSDDTFYVKNYEYDRGMKMYHSKKEILDILSIQILSHFSEIKDEKNIFYSINNYVINEEGGNLSSLVNYGKIREDRLKRLVETQAPEIILQNEKKMLDEILLKLIKLRCRIIIMLQISIKSKHLSKLFDKIFHEFNKLDNAEIQSLGSLKILETYILLTKNNENELIIKFNKVDFYSKLSTISIDDFASHLLNHVSLIECVKFLDDIEGKWDSESFVEKNQGQLSKYLENNPSKYYLLSRFKSNSKLKNFLINNHFKTKFKKNQDLSVFEKVIKIEPFQELIDLHK